MTDDSRITAYIEAVKQQFSSGHAREHAYRPALERLMASFEDVTAVNDPKRSQHGNPDFVFLKKSNQDVTFGYAEAKDITNDLAKTLESEQLRRYAGYEKLFLTNYLEFKFFRNGEQYEEVSIGKIANNQIKFKLSQFSRLEDVLQEFLDQPPETIRSGKRLALIMGGKARRIRDNVRLYLTHANNEQNAELEKIYHVMKELLVHDLSTEKFADMYAQTLVYGLFVARYNDDTPEDFDRKEARDLVPASNPFLREFFNHIVGPHFDSRLAYIVDELCDVFAVSNVQTLVHKHLRLFEVDNEKDPIIHFYEDFLKEYDPEERKKMGAYYTPVPVVKFIIGQVDKVLKTEFNLDNGLADTSKIEHTASDTAGNKYKFPTHKVQILDPAVGTATFLNEIIKFVRTGFEGQEGTWPSYAKENLLPRLYGFELMMAPYTIAHLKLGMTLQETGVKDFNQRLGVYLTNTLEEGVKHQQDLFSIGLAAAVSYEAEEAAKIKHEKPIMVIVGNPPYSISSSNKSDYILKLIQDYKKNLNERKINLDDDYIKFIRFTEEVIANNAEGIVSMITNNSYIDGVTHRQMRKHLLETFDKIYILDLHGNSKKKETAPDGSKDENVFNIQQGVSIIVAVKTSISKKLGEVFHAEIYGLRKDKFKFLSEGQIEWTKLNPLAPYYFFVPKDFSLQQEYDNNIKITDLFIKYSVGIGTKVDHIATSINKNELLERVEDILLNRLNLDQIREKYGLNDNTTWEYSPKVNVTFDPNKVARYEYRPFDYRYVYYDNNFLSRSRSEVMDNFYLHNNIGLATSRGGDDIFIGKLLSDEHYISAKSFRFPLYIYHEEEKLPNFHLKVLKKLTVNLSEEKTPEEILDYIYSVLQSANYRKKYAEFLKIDFPHIPVSPNEENFNRLSALGKELRQLHTMDSPILNKLITTYPVEGNDTIDKVAHKDDAIWINSTQYFGGVTKELWDFNIGSYQPAQKWLKDRKDRKLTNDDIAHYQKIIKILSETMKVVNAIDTV